MSKKNDPYQFLHILFMGVWQTETFRLPSYIKPGIIKNSLYQYKTRMEIIERNTMPKLSKEVAILYFSLFREQAKISQETVVTDATNLSELYREISKKYGFQLSLTHLRVAKNNQFCDWETSLENGDVIAFIPPVAGG